MIPVTRPVDTSSADAGTHIADATDAHAITAITNGANLAAASNTFSGTDFIVSGNGGKDTLALSNTTADVGITIGVDTNLYRSAANTLKTDDNVVVVGNVTSSLYVSANDSTANQATLGYTGAGVGPGLSFGAGLDTNLYRSAANTLKTDDKFVTASYIESTNGFYTADTGQAGMNTPDNSKLAFRAGGQDGRMTISVDGQLSLPADGSSGGILIGTDTALFRSAATTLKTDAKFLAGAGLGVGNSAAATVLGSVTTKMEVFNGSGVSLGFVPIYDAIT